MSDAVLLECRLSSATARCHWPTAMHPLARKRQSSFRDALSLRRSTLNGSAIVITSGYPSAAQTMARPIPVFPLVASMTVWPGLSSPDFSAASITPRANRSFTEPRGLKASIFTKRFTPCGAKRLIRTTGVLPIVSTILWYVRPMRSSQTLRCLWRAILRVQSPSPALRRSYSDSAFPAIGDAKWNCRAEYLRLVSILLPLVQELLHGHPRLLRATVTPARV